MGLEVINVESAYQGQFRIIITHIEERSIRTIFQWRVKIDRLFVDKSQRVALPSLLNLVKNFQANLAIRFFKKLYGSFKLDVRNQSISGMRQPTVWQPPKKEKLDTWLASIFFAPKGFTHIV